MEIKEKKLSKAMEKVSRKCEKLINQYQQNHIKTKSKKINLSYYLPDILRKLILFPVN